MNWRSWHHGYYGLALFLVAGWLAVTLPTWPWRTVYGALALLGAWAICDDLYQHIRQTWQPDYLSSLHRWFYRQPCAQWGWVKRLNRWLDEKFGG